MQLTDRYIFILAGLACVAGVANAAGLRGGQRDPAQLLERSDLNGDGRIARAEYANARAKMFDRLDRNRDGEVNQADAPKRRFARASGASGSRLKELAETMDTNRDGRVTRGEFVDGPSPLFDRADTDRDGFVTQSEIAAIRSAGIR